MSLPDFTDFVGVVVVVGERTIHVFEVEIIVSGDLFGFNTTIKNALGDMMNTNPSAGDTWSAAERVVSGDDFSHWLVYACGLLFFVVSLLADECANALFKAIGKIHGTNIGFIRRVNYLVVIRFDVDVECEPFVIVEDTDECPPTDVDTLCDGVR